MLWVHQQSTLGAGMVFKAEWPSPCLVNKFQIADIAAESEAFETLEVSLGHFQVALWLRCHILEDFIRCRFRVQFHVNKYPIQIICTFENKSEDASCETVENRQDKTKSTKRDSFHWHGMVFLRDGRRNQESSQ